jgi:hypothetical protein
MSGENPRKLSLSEVAARCAQETQRFYNKKAYDSRYCYDLFRRAINEGNDEAWTQIYKQYEPQVVKWVRNSSLFKESGEEVQYFVNRAFERLSRSLTADKFSNGFSKLEAILLVLKKSAACAVIDHVRKFKIDQLTVNIEDFESGRLDAFEGVEATTPWKIIQPLLKNKREKLAFMCLFKWDMKANEIAEKYPEIFSSSKEIYRIRENVMKRLRRNADLKRFLGHDGGNES